MHREQNGHFNNPGEREQAEADEAQRFKQARKQAESETLAEAHAGASFLAERVAQKQAGDVFEIIGVSRQKLAAMHQSRCGDE